MNQSIDLVKEALARGRPALNEYDSKRFLSGFGVPVTREVLVPDAKTAAVEAARIGFPVTLKACGGTLFHKTDVGGVVLDLRSKDEVRKESHRLFGIQGCEGLLVQEMVMGNRELVCGLTRDPQFGPCVMFGLGGALTELLADVVFRVAPLTHWDAQQMIEEIRGSGIIEPFRGEPAAHKDVLAKTLMALGQIGLQCEGIVEIDINPMKIRTDGMPVSVDALITLATSQ